VSRAGFEREVARRLAVTKASNPKELEGSRGRKLKASTEREVATEMIKRALVEDQAAKLSVAVSAAAVKARVEADRAKAGADKFSSDLAKQGLTEESYADRVAGEMLVDAVGQKVCSGVQVTQDEAESFYRPTRTSSAAA
jgi:predicted transcriptional regulator